MNRLSLFLLMSLVAVAGADQLWYQPPDPLDTGVARSFYYADQYWNESADNFQIATAGEVIAVEWWGHDSYAPEPAMAEHFMIRIYEDVVPPGGSSQPGSLLVEEMHLSWMETWDGEAGHHHYMVDLLNPFPYMGGLKYWISIQVVSFDVPVSGWGIGFTPVEFGWDGYYANDHFSGWNIYQKDLAFGLYGDQPSATKQSDWSTLKTLY